MPSLSHAGDKHDLENEENPLYQSGNVRLFFSRWRLGHRTLENANPAGVGLQQKPQAVAWWLIFVMKQSLQCTNSDGDPESLNKRNGGCATVVGNKFPADLAPSLSLD